ncbi:type II toxin-antitoxin system Phd/YefM family antitoxin [Pengzhenrongella frigida]|uniref:Antitoxin n=1 Tax=Pengzhenrongella frigida TaxID=1259133 RepID=A0A4Q5N0R2_9MICO|nr:type II toxin-antitoxin system Phd/YefM family antitoxin [Cellulomonas sp. HLT2-17]
MDVEPLRTMGLAEAKAHLSALIAAVEGGESICLTRRGKPVATVSRVWSPGAPGCSREVPLDRWRARPVTCVVRRRRTAGGHDRRPVAVLMPMDGSFPDG